MRVRGQTEEKQEGGRSLWGLCACHYTGAHGVQAKDISHIVHFVSSADSVTKSLDNFSCSFTVLIVDS